MRVWAHGHPTQGRVEGLPAGRAGRAAVEARRPLRARPAATSDADRHEPARPRQARLEHRGDLLRPTFGRAWPTPDELVSHEGSDPLAGWYATEFETAAGIVDLYRRVQAFADETIDALPLDAIGHVAHWGGEEVTLHQIMVHKTADLQRHAGHADILREQLDGSVGLLPRHSNVPDTIDWPAHTRRLRVIAEQFDRGAGHG